MTVQCTISSDGISATNDLYLENFYLSEDKQNLQFEVERLKSSLDVCKSDLEVYKFLLKEYQKLYNEVLNGRKV